MATASLRTDSVGGRPTPAPRRSSCLARAGPFPCFDTRVLGDRRALLGRVEANCRYLAHHHHYQWTFAGWTMMAKKHWRPVAKDFLRCHEGTAEPLRIMVTHTVRRNLLLADWVEANPGTRCDRGVGKSGRRSVDMLQLSEVEKWRFASDVGLPIAPRWQHLHAQMRRPCHLRFSMLATIP